VQYARYLAALAEGRFGRSLRERRPVVEPVGGRVGAQSGTCRIGASAPLRARIASARAPSSVWTATT
jgi:hypothetical protein